MEYSSYELSVLDEIREWEEARPGMIIKALDLLGKPVTTIIDSVPGSSKRIIANGISAFLAKLRHVSYWTYSDERILKKARSMGIKADTLTDLASEPLEKLDALARSHFSMNKLIAAMEGAGCGLGGLSLIAADVPALFTICFRSVQQIGTCYGFNMQDPAMLPIVMGIIHAGSGYNVAVKSALLADMHIAAAALAGKAAYGALAERTRTVMLVEILKKSSRSLPAHIAKNISSRKLSQAIPVIGAVLGAGFNYWFTSSAVVSAYMIFRKLSIERAHSDIIPEAAPSFIRALRRKLAR